MKKILKKVFFYFVNMFFIFLWLFWKILDSNAIIVDPTKSPTRWDYGVSKWGDFISTLDYILSVMFLAIYFIIVPIIFFIWLYNYFKKDKDWKIDKKSKSRGKKIMIWAIVILIVTFIISNTVKRILDIMTSGWSAVS